MNRSWNNTEARGLRDEKEPTMREAWIKVNKHLIHCLKHSSCLINGSSLLINSLLKKLDTNSHEKVYNCGEDDHVPKTEKSNESQGRLDLWAREPTGTDKIKSDCSPRKTREYSVPTQRKGPPKSLIWNNGRRTCRTWWNPPTTRHPRIIN